MKKRKPFEWKGKARLSRSWRRKHASPVLCLWPAYIAPESPQFMEVEVTIREITKRRVGK